MWFKFKKYNNNTLGGILINLVITFAILILLAVVFFYAYLPAITNHNESITVPNIEGMHVEKLEEFLVTRNLRWEVNDSSYSEDFPALTVLKQFPRAGSKVKENRKIYISVNRVNPPTVPMPNLVDRSVLNAEAVLKSNELRRGKIELIAGPFNVVQSMKYEGNVIKEGTRIPKGSVIDLVVMDGGSSKVETPRVMGYSLEDAKFLIFGANLNLGTIHLVGDTTGMDPVVLKQDPGAYTTSLVGDIIDLWLGKKGTPVPDEDETDY